MTKQPVQNYASEATLWMARVPPQRTRLIADLIRGKSLEYANRQLMLEKMKPAGIMLKLLRSAMANAAQKGVADMDRLFVSHLLVNEGPRIKRFMPRAQGRADVRLGRTSHIVLRLSERGAIAASTKKKSASGAAAAKKKTTKSKKASAGEE